MKAKSRTRVLLQSQETYPVDKSVPLPDKSGPSRKYPFHKMEVGDSFAYPAAERNSVSGAAWHAAKVLGRKFVTRKHGDGYRVWRVA